MPFKTRGIFVNDIGNVGIGTTDPQTLLHVGDGYTPSVAGITARVAGGIAAQQSVVSDGGNILSRSPANVNAAVLSLDASADPGGKAWSLVSNADNSPYGAPEGSLTFYSVQTAQNALSIEPNGNVGIGTENPSYPLHVETDGITGVYGHVINSTAINSGVCGRTDSPLGRGVYGLNADSSGGGLWAATSDRRLKKNIKDLDGALQRLLNLRGVTFQYKDPQTINETSGQPIGLIAQEVQPVFPDWVHEAPDGYLRVSEKGLTALTVEALRELREEKDREIEQLRSAHNREMAAHKREVESLRAENEELQQRFAKLESLVSQLHAQNN